MSFKKFLATLILFAVLIAPSAAFAEGFGIYEWSANGVGLAENNMFGEEDPAVLAYNPAAITRFDRAYFSTGASLINPKVKAKFHGLGPLNYGKNADWQNNYAPGVVPYAYYAKKAGANSWFGVGIFSRFGNQIEYDKLWPGRLETVFVGIKGVTVQPTYAFKLTPKFSAAVGLDINYMNLQMDSGDGNIVLGGTPVPYSKLDGTSMALGGVLSLMYDFTPNTSAALVYRSRIKHSMDADVDFYHALTPIPSTIARGSVTLPDSVSFGLGHKFNGGKTRVEFDAVWTNWATFDRLTMNFDNGLISDTEKNWKAAWRFGVGLEHQLSHKWSFLCGYVWDQSPIPDKTMDFMVPTGDRHRASFGFKHRPNDKSEWTLAYSGIWAGERPVYSKLAGLDYEKAELHSGFTNIVSLGYTMKF